MVILPCFLCFSTSHCDHWLSTVKWSWLASKIQHFRVQHHSDQRQIQDSRKEGAHTGRAAKMRTLMIFMTHFINVRSSIAVSTSSVKVLHQCQLASSVHVAFAKKALVQVNTRHALDPSISLSSTISGQYILVFCCVVIFL